MGIVKEFKEFALKGNLVDTAIAFVMGAAFGKVVTAFVQKMFAPIIGLALGGMDLSDKKTILKEAVLDTEGVQVTGEVAIMWGEFITACIDFTVVAFIMFLIIRGMNSMKKKEEAAPSAPPAPSKEEVLLGEIRDLLKK